MRRELARASIRVSFPVRIDAVQSVLPGGIDIALAVDTTCRGSRVPTVPQNRREAGCAADDLLGGTTGLQFLGIRIDQTAGTLDVILSGGRR